MMDPVTGSRSSERVATAVVIPAGPRDDVADTLDSVRCFVPMPRLVVVVNDAGAPEVDRLADLGEDVVVVAPPPGLPSGTRGGLWRKLAHAYGVVLERDRWDVVLRMDADALLIGPGIEAAAAARFRADPTIGVLGAFRFGPDGGARDWSPAAERLRRELGLRGLGRPRRRAALRTLVARAAALDYALGAHALGTCLLAPRLLRAWSELGWLDLPALGTSQLCDDQIVGLLAAAAGFRTEEMSGPGDLMAVQWKGLPSSPGDLLASGKALVHSVRFFGDLDERQIRAAFLEARTEGV